MKKMELFVIAIAINSMIACNMGSNNGQSISVRKTESKYQFKASFAERKTDKVFNYMKKALKEDKLFRDPKKFKDSDIILGDTIKFHLKSGPGLVEVTFRKFENSLPGYQTLEKMCTGIGEMLK